MMTDVENYLVRMFQLRTVSAQYREYVRDAIHAVRYERGQYPDVSRATVFRGPDLWLCRFRGPIGDDCRSLFGTKVLPVNADRTAPATVAADIVRSGFPDCIVTVR